MLLRVAGNDVYAYTGARRFDAALPTVVFVHGAANDHSVWALQSRYFAHHGCNVLAVDLPGHGRSGGAALASVEAIADWMPALLDAAGVSAAALVGHSLGSLAVLAAAARHPARVTQIALLGPAVPMPVGDVLLDAAQGERPRRLRADQRLVVQRGQAAGRQPGAGHVADRQRDAAHGAHAARACCTRISPPATRTPADSTAAAAVRCPALLILGARDLMAPPKSAQALIAALPDKRVVTLPDCGHALMAEQPDAVLDALAAFLRRMTAGLAWRPDPTPMPTPDDRSSPTCAAVGAVAPFAWLARGGATSARIRCRARSTAPASRRWAG